MVMPRREATKVIRVPVVLYPLLQRLIREHKEGNSTLIEEVKSTVAEYSSLECYSFDIENV
jgi:hypothetical protein